MPTPLDAAQLSAYFALMEVSGRLRHEIERQLRHDGDLSYAQFQILATLSDLAPAAPRMTDVADRLVIARSALTYQVSSLERAGLLARAPAPGDERSIVLELTRAGAERVAAVLPGHVALVRDQLIDRLSAAELAELARLLGRVRDGMRLRPPRSAAPRRPRTS